MTIDTQKITHWLLRADEPFKGHSQSFLLPDGTVAYTDGLTPRAYAKERGFPVKVITDAQLEALIERHTLAMITDPVEETEEAFWYALEVLPPRRWQTRNGVELFHISERIQGNLVSWHAQLAGRFFTMTQAADADLDVLADAVKAACKLASQQERKLS